MYEKMCGIERWLMAIECGEYISLEIGKDMIHGTWFIDIILC